MSSSDSYFSGDLINSYLKLNGHLLSDGLSMVGATEP